MIRIFSEANKAKFKDHLSREDWSNVLSSCDANECTIKLTSKVTKCFENAFPQQKLSKKRAKDKPWITNSLRKCIRKKNALFNKYHLQKSQISLEKFKKYKNILTSCLRQAEKNYYNDKFNEMKSRITSMWATLNSILNPKKKKSLITHCNK